MNYCCQKFKYQAELPPNSPGWFEFCEGWSIEGCCGGGCYVVSYMKYCPFCGSLLESPKGK